MGSLSSRETSPLPSSTGDAGEPPYVPLEFLYWQLGFWICGLWIFESRFVIGVFAIKDVIGCFVYVEVDAEKGRDLLEEDETCVSSSKSGIWD